MYTYTALPLPKFKVLNFHTLIFYHTQHKFLCRQYAHGKDVVYTVLKTGPDRPVRPVQPGTGSQSGPVNTPKTGQKPENRSKTGQKPGLNRKLKKKRFDVWFGF